MLQRVMMSAGVADVGGLESMKEKKRGRRVKK